MHVERDGCTATGATLICAALLLDKPPHEHAVLHVVVLAAAEADGHATVVHEKRPMPLHLAGIDPNFAAETEAIGVHVGRTQWVRFDVKVAHGDPNRIH